MVYQKKNKEGRRPQQVDTALYPGFVISPTNIVILFHLQILCLAHVSCSSD